MEFNLSHQARQKYQVDFPLLPAGSGSPTAEIHTARQLADKINHSRAARLQPSLAVRAGELNAMLLIDAIFEMVITLYIRNRKPQFFKQAFQWLEKKLGKEQVEKTLNLFVKELPPLIVYRGETDAVDYLASQTGSKPNRHLIIERMVLHWLVNENPACNSLKELCDDQVLRENSAYQQVITELHRFLDTQPGFGPENQNLIDMLRSPAIAQPHSLEAQLEYIRAHWTSLLGDLLTRLLRGLDLIREEKKGFLPPGPGIAQVPEFVSQEDEPERFSHDKDWMPNLVLIAKNTYVWLEQLSRKYQRPIHRLDEIPDEELEILARWGISGLWLIGLWERSRASKRIKQLRGNPEAEASAYSLDSYDISADLGGEGAHQELRRRAWNYHIRLAADMVPNHMGIDSQWVLEHPDWFISLDYSPYPAYTFNGPNLSPDPHIGIYLEDHYFDNSDAAVVFKRVDFWSGKEKFIYHGNDGTSMPWNDTAQLDYLNPTVREAVIQTILHVARRFPVIRFDAAMTLAKKHFQRLWFPEPGSGGAIPSRAEHGLSKQAFDAAMPKEFWREVVDRVAAEVPDTLLLAEAFWLMEGYFVRTLGMHRVYNSAFMNMLRDEKNQEYRLVIKNTLEFDPEILKRYVNFMNNPDERTAVDQFGTGDKYFGVCTLLATMPGLPMLGHGQIEGFTEKYGMEYRRAYWNEQPDPELVSRHEREIFPLLRKRYLFAGVRNFLLYDFVTADGYVNEDVFAYSNRVGEERALVVFHNKFAEARGWIRTSVSYRVKNGADGHALRQSSLAQGLGLSTSADTFTVFRDQISGQEFIRSNEELIQQGLYIELSAYKYQVFTGFHQIVDDQDGHYRQLASLLSGRGTPSIAQALEEMLLEGIYTPLRDLVNAGQIQWLVDHIEFLDKEKRSLPPILKEIKHKATRLITSIQDHTHTQGDRPLIAETITQETKVALQLLSIANPSAPNEPALPPRGRSFLAQPPNRQEKLSPKDTHVWAALFIWIFLHNLGKLKTDGDHADSSRAWFDQWHLDRRIHEALLDMGLSSASASSSVELIQILISHQGWFRQFLASEDPSSTFIQEFFNDEDVRRFTKVNRHNAITWFHKESFEELLWWLYIVAVIQMVYASDDLRQTLNELDTLAGGLQTLSRAAYDCGYQLDQLSSWVKPLTG